MNPKYSFCNYSEKASLPLYKYYGNLEYARDAIINNRIHLESPSEYNDIYDSTFQMTESTLKATRVRATYLCETIKKAINPKYHDALEKYLECEKQEWVLIIDIIKFVCDNTDGANQKELVDEFIASMIGDNLPQANNNKISCFSERNDSILMWAYYANNYSGVCLGFDISKDNNLKKHCHKVTYSHYLSEGAEAYNNYFRKSDEWVHEQEWRIVCYTDESYLPTTAISSIILGPRMSSEHRIQFIELGKKNNIDIYTIVPSQNEFKLKVMLLQDNAVAQQ